MRKNIILSLLGATLLVVSMYSCKKSGDNLTVPPSEAHFIGEDVQAYAVRSAGVGAFTINVGTTDVASYDRTISFKVTSATAVAGTQYTLSTGTTNTVTIPAGQATASFTVQGLIAGYPAGRVDTLLFAITEPSLKPAAFGDTVKLAVGDICTEADIVPSELVGTYTKSFDAGIFVGGPYTTSIVSVTPINATSANVVLRDLWLNDFTFKIDWSNPDAPAVSFATQNTGYDGGILSASYAGQPLRIAQPASGSAGTYSYCNKKFTIYYRLCVTAGCFTNACSFTTAP